MTGPTSFWDQFAAEATEATRKRNHARQLSATLRGFETPKEQFRHLDHLDHLRADRDPCGCRGTRRDVHDEVGCGRWRVGL